LYIALVYGGELNFTNIMKVYSASFSVNTWPGQNILYSDSFKCVLLIEGKYRMSSVLTFLIFWDRFFMKLQKNTRKIRS